MHTAIKQEHNLAGTVTRLEDNRAALTDGQMRNAYGRTVVAVVRNKVAAFFDPLGAQAVEVGIQVLCQSRIILDNIHKMQWDIADVQQQVQTEGRTTRQLMTDLIHKQEHQIKQAFEDQRSFLECIHGGQAALAAQQRSIAQMTLQQIALVETNLIHYMDRREHKKLLRLLDDVSDYICQLRKETGELQRCVQYTTHFCRCLQDALVLLTHSCT